MPPVPTQAQFANDALTPQANKGGSVAAMQQAATNSYKPIVMQPGTSTSSPNLPNPIVGLAPAHVPLPAPLPKGPPKPLVVSSTDAATKDLQAKQDHADALTQGAAQQAADKKAAEQVANAALVNDKGATQNGNLKTQERTPTAQENAKAFADTLNPPTADQQAQAKQDSLQAVVSQGYTDPNQVLQKLNFDAQGNKIANWTLQDVSNGIAKATPPGPLDAANVEMQKLNDQADQAFTQWNTAIQSIQNGTFPLTPNQQAQLDSTTNRYKQLIAEQKIANQNYTSGVTISGISSGRQRYAPEIAFGQIMGSISAGIQKISKIEGDMSDALSKLKDGFDTQDYKLINDQYDKLTSLLKGKSDAVSKMATAAQDHLDKVISQNQAQQKIDQDAIQNEATNKLANARLSWEEKSKAVDQALANATLDQKAKADLETTRHNQATEAIAAGTLALARAKEAFAQGVLPNGVSAGINTSPEDKMKMPGVLTTANGAMYFDESQISDKTQLAAAERVARGMGLPIVSAKDSDAVRQVDNALVSLDTLMSAYQNVAPTNLTGPDAISKGLHNVYNWGSKTLMPGSTQGGQIAAFDGNRDTLFNTISALAGGTHPRINQQELELAKKSLPNSGDTPSEAKQKFDLTRQYLNNALTAQVQNKLQYNSLDNYMKSVPDAQSKIQKITDSLAASGINVPDNEKDATLLQLLTAQDAQP